MNRPHYSSHPSYTNITLSSVHLPTESASSTAHHTSHEEGHGKQHGDKGHGQAHHESHKQPNDKGKDQPHGNDPSQKPGDSSPAELEELVKKLNEVEVLLTEVLKTIPEVIPDEGMNREHAPDGKQGSRGAKATCIYTSVVTETVTGSTGAKSEGGKHTSNDGPHKGAEHSSEEMPGKGVKTSDIPDRAHRASSRPTEKYTGALTDQPWYTWDTAFAPSSTKHGKASSSKHHHHTTGGHQSQETGVNLPTESSIPAAITRGPEVDPSGQGKHTTHTSSSSDTIGKWW